VLDEIPVDLTNMLRSTMTTKVYDGSIMQVVGTIKIKLFIGSQMFLVTLQVMEIHSSYNMLLGRPWIHAADAVS
jgi:hypothetical protein